MTTSQDQMLYLKYFERSARKTFDAGKVPPSEVWILQSKCGDSCPHLLLAPGDILLRYSSAAAGTLSLSGAVSEVRCLPEASVRVMILYNFEIKL